MPTISFRCDKEVVEYFEELTNITGMNRTDLIIKLCLEGKVSDISNARKDQMRIKYHLNSFLHIINDLQHIGTYCNPEKKIDQLVAKILIKMEHDIAEIQDDLRHI